METEKINKYSEIEFRFDQPLNEEQEDWFKAYFKNVKHSVMDRLTNVIHGTDRNPIKAIISKQLGPLSPGIMMKFESLYSILLTQSPPYEARTTDIFVLEDERKTEGIWTYRMDMSQFDMVTIESLSQYVKQKIIQQMIRKSLNLLSDKDRRIRLEFQRIVLPKMKLRVDQCKIVSRFYDEEEKKEV